MGHRAVPSQRAGATFNQLARHQSVVLAEEDVRVEAIADHADSAAIDAEPAPRGGEAGGVSAS